MPAVNPGPDPNADMDNDFKKQQLNGKTKEQDVAPENFAVLNQGEEDEMEVYGYLRCWVRTSLCWTLVVLTLGWTRLLLHWWPHWMLLATHKQCSLKRATKLLAVDRYQNHHKSYFVKRVEIFDLAGDGHAEEGEKSAPVATRIWLGDGTTREVSRVRWVRIKKLRYVWDDRVGRFARLSGLDGVDAAEIHSMQPLGVEQQALRRRLYGSNCMEVAVQNVTALVLLELLNPFYVFQIFSLAVWFAEEYYYYTIAIVIMSTFGITFTVRQTRRNQLSLRRTVQSSDVVTVSRGGGVFQDVGADELVPGDVIAIPQRGCTLHCDAVLLNGHCIVNESMLTGESVPVTKTPLGRAAGVPYDAKDDARHTLFCGTTVIQTRFYGEHKVLAVVIRTGYLTSKGALVRSILYPPPADFRFERDSYKFIGILAVIALAGLIYTCIAKGTRGVSAGDIAQKALDLITIVIPPALPSALSVGKLCAQNRLQNLNIFCVNSRVINVAGSLDCVCFDKTGTLTEDGLDLWGVVPVETPAKANTDAPGAVPTPISLGAAVKDPRDLPDNLPLLCAMAACHSLTRIDGNLAGDPLDVKMFESTGWEFEEPSVPDTAKFDLLVPSLVRAPNQDTTDPEKVPYEIGLVHQYQFSSTLQRMSVVTRQLGAPDLVLYSKGSPEVIAALCAPHTVPARLGERLGALTAQGYRVLGAARRALPASSLPKLLRLPRAEVETDLEFAGLIVMENRLKPQTSGVIQELRQARIKVVMVTGDNVQTAVSVARECGLVAADQSVISVDVVPGDKGGPPKLTYTLASPPCPSNVFPNDMRKKLMKSVSVEGGLEVNNAPYQLAVTGRVWAEVREHFPEMVPRLCVRGAVFARMSSDQKQQLVNELQDLGYYVGMCGDGANDCGALKAAHTGISLSEAESSVASPLTARDAHIGCVPHVIREGRAALSTSIGIFKFMVAYSLTEFASAIVLYGMDSNLTGLQFLFIDVGLILNIAFLFSKTEAFKGPLFPHAPLTSLLSLNPLLSLGLLMASNIVFQAAAYNIVRYFPWFTPFNPVNSKDYACLENYSVFTVSMFQYITMAVAFSQGAPYRQSILTNRWFTASLALMTVVCAYITVWPAGWVVAALELAMPPVNDYRVFMVMMGAANFAVCMFCEKFIVQWLLQERLRYWRHDVTKSRRKYLLVDKQLREDLSWPSLDAVPSATAPPAVDRPQDQPPPLQATVLRASQRVSTPAPSAPGATAPNGVHLVPLSLGALSSVPGIPGGPSSALSDSPNGMPSVIPTVSQIVSASARLESTRL